MTSNLDPGFAGMTGSRWIAACAAITIDGRSKNAYYRGPDSSRGFAFLSRSNALRTMPTPSAAASKNITKARAG